MNKDQRTKISQLKINEVFELENGVLSVDELMKVEGGADFDEDDCKTATCVSKSKACYINV